MNAGTARAVASLETSPSRRSRSTRICTSSGDGGTQDNYRSSQVTDLHPAEADGYLYQCESCDRRFLQRAPGDMADLNQLCRRCAEEYAAQVEADYNLPLGSSDEDRTRALEDLPPGTEVFALTCMRGSCPQYRKPWHTSVTLADWRSAHGKSWHCFSCGYVSVLLGAWEAE